MATCTRCLQPKTLEEMVYRKDRQKYQTWCILCKRDLGTKWSKSNPDKRRISKTACVRNARKTNPAIKLKDRLRSRLNSALKEFLVEKTVSHIKDLGCTIPFLVSYIQSQWEPGMNWDNHGNTEGTWQIDHIIPFCAVSKGANLLDIVNYKNLRPLWYKDHLIKSLNERT